MLFKGNELVDRTYDAKEALSGIMTDVITLTKNSGTAKGILTITRNVNGSYGVAFTNIT